jgi:hypothetical protein
MQSKHQNDEICDDEIDDEKKTRSLLYYYYYTLNILFYFSLMHINFAKKTGERKKKVIKHILTNLN